MTDLTAKAENNFGKEVSDMFEEALQKNTTLTNLEYDAACSGCESAKEANPKTIERLIKKVKDNDLKVIFVIELSESKIADTIISDLKGNGITVSKKTFYSMHNVSKDDYKNGLTYIDYMNMNIESLKEALK